MYSYVIDSVALARVVKLQRSQQNKNLTETFQRTAVLCCGGNIVCVQNVRIVVKAMFVNVSMICAHEQIYPVFIFEF